MTNLTIQGTSIHTISSLFIAKINEPGVQSLGDDFFVVHDCIHWFTGLGVSIPEEKLIAEIQSYMLGNLDKDLSEEAKYYIDSLIFQEVYEELKTNLIVSREVMFSQF